MAAWVEIVDPKWEETLQELGRVQNCTRLSEHWWEAKHKLGSGTFGKVRWVQHKNPQDGDPKAPCAAKVIEDRKPPSHTAHRHREQTEWAIEWHIHKLVSGHPNIVTLFATYYSQPNPVAQAKIVYIMELCQPHDLDDFMHHYGDVSISDATLWMLHLCTGIGHLHSHSVMHRDLKPGNCLLAHRPRLSPMLKLADMGAAAVITRMGDQSLPTRPLLQDVTTFQYAAPEVLRHENYNFPADIWGAGVICWEMLQSDPRVHAVRLKESDGFNERLQAMTVFQEVVEAQREKSKEVPMLHLAWCMLQEPSERPTASSALEFDVFGLISPISGDVDVATEKPASPTSGDIVAAAGKPASPISGAAGVGLATPKPVERQASHSTQPNGGAERLDLPQRPLDVVIAVGDLMRQLLPGDVPAFNQVMHRQMVNIIKVYACVGYRCLIAAAVQVWFSFASNPITLRLVSKC